MLRPICYHSDIALAPVIAGALAAHGYRITIPPCLCGDASTIVMSYGATEVLLVEATQTATVEIEISGVAAPLTAQLLESLPIKLHKQESQ